jgi:Glyoxalase/Bleomycin resistance protein/Dioxygenase superfamily.
MVNNLEESIEFYETITKLTISRRFNAGPGEIAFMTNGSGETEIELIFMPQGPRFEGKGITICFETDNLEAVQELAQVRSLNPSDIRNPDIENRYFYVYDPNGVSVQFKQKL